MDKIEWHALEYTPRNNSSDWYWAVGIIAISIAVVSIFYGNILFAILIILAAFTLAMYAAKHPKTLSCEINMRGVRLEKNFYPYESLESFWVDEHHHEPKLLIKSKKLLMPLIIMPLEEVHPADIRDFLLMHLNESELAEPITQKLLDYLGF